MSSRRMISAVAALSCVLSTGPAPVFRAQADRFSSSAMRASQAADRKKESPVLAGLEQALLRPELTAGAGLEADAESGLRGRAKAWHRILLSDPQALEWRADESAPTEVEIQQFLVELTPGKTPETFPKRWQQYIAVVGGLMADSAWASLSQDEKTARIAGALSKLKLRAPVQEAAPASAPVQEAAAASTPAQQTVLPPEPVQAAAPAPAGQAVPAEPATAATDEDVLSLAEQAVELAEGLVRTIGQQAAELERARDRIVSAVAELEKERGELASARQEVQDLESNLRASETSLTAARDEAGRKQQQVEDLQRQLEEARRQLEQATDHVRQLEADRDNLIQQIGEARGQIQNLEGNVRAIHADLQSAQERLTKEQEEAGQAKTDVEAMQAKVQRLNGELSGLRAQVEQLTQRAEAAEALAAAEQGRQAGMAERLAPLQKRLDALRQATTQGKPRPAAVQPLRWKPVKMDNPESVTLSGGAQFRLVWASPPKSKAVNYRSKDAGKIGTLGRDGSPPLALLVLIARNVVPWKKPQLSANRWAAGWIQDAFTSREFAGTLEGYLEKPEAAEALLLDRLAKTVQDVHDAVKGQADEAGAAALELALFVGDRAFLVHAGSGRTYAHRPSEAERTGTLERLGADLQDASGKPIQAIGLDLGGVEVLAVSIQDGDEFLLASEGAIPADVLEGQIAQILNATEKAVQTHLGRIMVLTAPDAEDGPRAEDATVAVVRVIPASEPPPPAQAGLEDLGAGELPAVVAEAWRADPGRTVVGPVLAPDAEGIPRILVGQRVGLAPAPVQETPGPVALIQAGVVPPEASQRLIQAGWRVEVLPAQLSPARLIGEVAAGLAEWDRPLVVIVGPTSRDVVRALPAYGRVTAVVLSQPMAQALGAGGLFSYLMQIVREFPGRFLEPEVSLRVGAEEAQVVSRYL